MQPFKVDDGSYKSTKKNPAGGSMNRVVNGRQGNVLFLCDK